MLNDSPRFYVYEHWRLDRDECFYVGKGKGKRAYNMKHGRNNHHKAIMLKMSRIGSSVEVRIVADGLDEAAAFQLERERIKFWRDAKVDIVNLTDGGDGTSGFKYSEESRAKMSFARRNMPQEQRDRIAEQIRNMPQEQREKRAEKARNMPQEQRDKIAEKVRLVHASMTLEQKADKSEKGRINAMKRWSVAK
jgi:hypothetical protein